MEILTAIFFYIVAGVLILCALATILMPRIIYSVLSAILTFLAVGGIYFMLNATFNGVAQFAIYVLAVALLLVFAIMLTPHQIDKKLWLALKPRSIFTAFSTAFVFLSLLAALFEDFFNRIILEFAIPPVLNESIDTIYVIGEKIFIDYVLAFELVSILLLGVIVGIGVITTLNRKEEKYND